ncbi:hypothetical protein RHSIM_Rhsim02G0150300 [Rhododendron simsii]|uniref:RNA ligase/cyclic nucleotide phosphodiesterase family protein n=1 Tax=Rhododendron simsii TaxID=118357 RepID=A0A834LX53_RHOSS|nr:hypothetical protein RHSIM_Rhsim02G0150300 [Rhododendron simsii]
MYSVWVIPPEDVTERLKKPMARLRSEFGGPEFEPHGVKAYTATVEKVATGTFFYECIFLLLHPTPQVVEASSHCTGHFGYKSSTPYMPHLSILYGDLSNEEKKKAQAKANILDENISSLRFQISSLALYKADTEDMTLKSWKKIAEFNLDTN